MTYKEQLAAMTDEELRKQYGQAMESYKSWQTSQDGSDGACWDYEVQPVLDEMKKRGIEA